MINKVQPVVLCGGAGTRLWPLSRSTYPKQFLKLLGDETLFQESLSRVSSISLSNFEFNSPLVVTSTDYHRIVSDQAAEKKIELSQILIEGAAKNTAPALTLAALSAIQGNEDPILFVTPSDHLVGQEERFHNVARNAIDLASKGRVVILGIKPTRAETGYGYIKSARSTDGVHAVDRFIEKPSKQDAEKLLKEGVNFWNAGIFIIRASVWLAALNLFAKEIHDSVQTVWETRKKDGKLISFDETIYDQVPPNSIDYAVMEPCSNGGSESSKKFEIQMLELDAEWDDLGTWSALWSASRKSDLGFAASGDVININSRDTLVKANSRLVCLLGVNNLTVIETEDAILVADKSLSNEVTKITDELARQGREELNSQTRSYRPWGYFDIIDSGESFKVKRITVNPGGSLSLQEHKHRSEHWVVVSGIAEVTKGARKLVLKKNESIHICVGERHRLRNVGDMPLIVIETQSGEYLGEDDITRFEDIYDRSS